MSRLAATVHEDPLPEDDPAPCPVVGLVGGSAWSSCWGPARPGAAQRSRCSISTAATATGGTRSCSTPNTTCRCRPTSWCPTARTAPGRGGPGVPRARARQGPGRRSGVHRHARTPTTRCSGAAGLCGSGARSALFRRTVGLESRGPLRLRHQPGARLHGGLESADPERVGPAAGLDVLRDHPLVDPGPHRHGRALLWRHRDAVHRRPRPARGRRRGQRVLLVVGGEPQDAVEHVRLADRCIGMLGRLEHEDLGALIAPRPLLIETGHRRPLFPVAAATESVRRTRLVYDAQGAATGWCTTSSRGSTSGTAPRPGPS